MIHNEPFDRAGEECTLTNGTTVRIEDWWDRVYGGSWMYAQNNFAALDYAMRSATEKLPLDNEVVYGQGQLIHISEIADSK